MFVFKVFIEFVTVLFLFYVLVFWSQGRWDLSSLTRDLTHTPCKLEGEVLNTGPPGKSYLSSSLPLEDFPGGWVVKNLPAIAGNVRHGFDPWVRKIPWGKKWQLTPVFLLGKFWGQRSLVGCAPLGCKELRWLRTHMHSLPLEGKLCEGRVLEFVFDLFTLVPSLPRKLLGT